MTLGVKKLGSSTTRKGRTTGPDLVSISTDANDRRMTLTFDEDVDDEDSDYDASGIYIATDDDELVKADRDPRDRGQEGLRQGRREPPQLARGRHPRVRRRSRTSRATATRSGPSLTAAPTSSARRPSCTATTTATRTPTTTERKLTLASSLEAPALVAGAFGAYGPPIAALHQRRFPNDIATAGSDGAGPHRAARRGLPCRRSEEGPGEPNARLAHARRAATRARRIGSTAARRRPQRRRHRERRNRRTGSARFSVVEQNTNDDEEEFVRFCFGNAVQRPRRRTRHPRSPWSAPTRQWARGPPS